MTLISVIVPVFNGENYLSATIDSILASTKDSECEVIVVDDGSTDSTSVICARYGNRINYFRQNNQGEFSATNNGLFLAKGNYILVVSHDDPMLSRSLIPKAIGILEKNPELVCAYPDWQVIDSNGLVIDTKIVKEYSEVELLGRFNCLPGPGAVFRRKDAIEIGGRRNWKYVSDYDFWLRLSRRGEFIRIPEVLAQWRSHENSTTVSMKTLEMAQERIDVVEDFINTNKVDKKISQMSLSSAYYFAARLGVFSSKIPAKKWIATSFLKRRGWPEVANPLIVLFILTLPFSKFLLKLLIPFSNRLKAVF
jgi:glycosyltransferase involved in cell wall biosynthesis